MFCQIRRTPSHRRSKSSQKQKHAIRKKRAHREERQSGVRAYAAIAEIAVTDGKHDRDIERRVNVEIKWNGPCSLF
ncbi:hypothetical protein EVAR_57819_1 [Eumeta japonica]|uniref:Uncharacterized protein n=1 Tax=Eumeta variegata TaxID=151549 RepID=A0A4C1ZYG3_EUMVA|nr:hypothetical protein EVAR_57819_1 [Eumeta japonica]